MEINDILSQLGLDLSNPEAKRGAIEAIEAILASRAPQPTGGTGGGGGGLEGGEDTEVEIDPDLLQPSVKQIPINDDDDIEIEDEEKILDQVKHKEAEDPIEQNGGGKNTTDSDQTSTDEEDSTQSAKPAETAGEESDSSGESTDETEEATDTVDDTEEVPTTDTSGEPTEETNPTEDEASSEEGVVDGEDPTESEEETEEAEVEEDEWEFDEEDLVDDELKTSAEDKEIQAKQEARRVKRERTLAAAKAALDKAKAKNVSQPLIRELEKAIEALESLTEAKAKSLSDLSDEEFNLMVNRVFDAISAVGDKDLTFSSDEERKLKAQEIKTDLGSRETQQALSDEDIAAIRAETQAVKAREKETAIYKKPAASSFKGFQAFLSSLYRAIALQVQTNEVQDDTWSAINRRYSGTGVLKQGQRKNELPDRKIPIIDFYFDQSGSWNEQDIAAGKKAVEALVDMEEKGQIKINIYYFSNHVFNDAASARAEGGTRAWNDIVKNVIATQATNVVIMTDSDMEGWWEGSKALTYTVPGYVWYLWRNGDNAPRLPRDLKGRGGVQQFSFNRGDV